MRWIKTYRNNTSAYTFRTKASFEKKHLTVKHFATAESLSDEFARPEDIKRQKADSTSKVNLVSL